MWRGVRRAVHTTMRKTKQRLRLDDVRMRNQTLDALPVEGLGPDAPIPRSVVPDACFSPAKPTPVLRPVTVAGSLDALQKFVQVDPQEMSRNDFADFFTGNKLFTESNPSAHCYCGHQFGYFSGQLGDGATMYLGEVVPPGDSEPSQQQQQQQQQQNQDAPAQRKGGQCSFQRIPGKWELQIKGGGRTPFSRSADGRKVLRSSIREFLCSEFMASLRVPTTRAASCVTSDGTVDRDIRYDGDIKPERCTVVSRVAASFLRFGSFEIAKPEDPVTERAGPSAGNRQLLTHLARYVIQAYYPHVYARHVKDGHGWVGAYAQFYREVVQRSATLVAKWQCYGFTHGVLNTDNMSILGLTIDYGPFGFQDWFDPMHTPNGSDDGQRYCYREQPAVVLWNCLRLADMLGMLLDGPVELRKGASGARPSHSDSTQQDQGGGGDSAAGGDLPSVGFDFHRLARQVFWPQYYHSYYALASLKLGLLPDHMSALSEVSLQALESWVHTTPPHSQQHHNLQEEKPTRMAVEPDEFKCDELGSQFIAHTEKKKDSGEQSQSSSAPSLDQQIEALRQRARDAVSDTSYDPLRYLLGAQESRGKRGLHEPDPVRQWCQLGLAAGAGVCPSCANLGSPSPQQQQGQARWCTQCGHALADGSTAGGSHLSSGSALPPLGSQADARAVLRALFHTMTQTRADMPTVFRALAALITPAQAAAMCAGTAVDPGRLHRASLQWFARHVASSVLLPDAEADRHQPHMSEQQLQMLAYMLQRDPYEFMRRVGHPKIVHQEIERRRALQRFVQGLSELERELVKTAAAVRRGENDQKTGDEASGDETEASSSGKPSAGKPQGSSSSCGKTGGEPSSCSDSSTDTTQTPDDASTNTPTTADSSTSTYASAGGKSLCDLQQAVREQRAQLWTRWARQYTTLVDRLLPQDAEDGDLLQAHTRRHAVMLAFNPRFVLRNWVLEDCIRDAKSYQSGLKTTDDPQFHASQRTDVDWTDSKQPTGDHDRKAQDTGPAIQDGDQRTVSSFSSSSSSSSSYFERGNSAQAFRKVRETLARCADPHGVSYAAGSASPVSGDTDVQGYRVEGSVRAQHSTGSGVGQAVDGAGVSGPSSPSSDGSQSAVQASWLTAERQALVQLLVAEYQDANPSLNEGASSGTEQGSLHSPESSGTSSQQLEGLLTQWFWTAGADPTVSQSDTSQQDGMQQSSQQAVSLCNALLRQDVQSDFLGYHPDWFCTSQRSDSGGEGGGEGDTDSTALDQKDGMSGGGLHSPSHRVTVDPFFAGVFYAPLPSQTPAGSSTPHSTQQAEGTVSDGSTPAQEGVGGLRRPGSSSLQSGDTCSNSKTPCPLSFTDYFGPPPERYRALDLT